jgi:very-short-patch-repair endonuclease
MPDVRSLGPAYRAQLTQREREIAAFAEAQHGVVSRRQLSALGLARGAIAHRIAIGRLHVVHRGIYAVGHRRLTARGRWMAAVLACPDGALLSHLTASALWGLPTPASLEVDVTVVGRSRGRIPGLRLHRTETLLAADRATRDNIPVTSVARTLLDLAEVVSVPQLRRSIAEAKRLRMVTLEEIQDTCSRSPGRRALRPVRAILSEYRPPERTRSELEVRFARLCRDAGLPAAIRNRVVAGHEVDVLWPDQGLAVDTYTYHHAPGDFESDRARDSDLQLAGYRVVRITDRRLEEEPKAVLDLLRRLLGMTGERTTTRWTGRLTSL